MTDISDGTCHFEAILTELTISESISRGRWFSLPAMLAQGKVFAALWLNGDMVFKLYGRAHARALALSGSRLFQPMPDRKPMGEWVQVPPLYAEQWRDLSLDALEYVRDLAEPRKRAGRKKSERP